MRLLNAKTLKLTQFARDVPPYAIVSHTWGDEEVSYQEIDLPERTAKKGFAKILGCCRQALKDTLEWVWVDTCCIDKTSSAELSEAINSMYAWYRSSEICYVYLEDVSTPDAGFPEREFWVARWFTRGWCLQELIAPSVVEFYTADWHDIGTKFSLCDLLEMITAVTKPVLLGWPNALEMCSIAEKMSWASKRQTTRIEDEAYCLLGIFGVNMPMLYGEGPRAFYRLQEEIIKQTEDYSFLLWTEVPKAMEQPEMELSRFPIFAPRPACFARAGPYNADGRRIGYHALQARRSGVSQSDPDWTWNPPQVTSRGLRVSLPGGTRVPGLPERHYLLWTGYTHHADFVCVLLVRNQFDGIESYLRAGRGCPEVRLLGFGEARNLGPRDIYLSINRTPWQPGFESNNDRELPPCPRVLLDVVISPLDSIPINLIGTSHPSLVLRQQTPNDHAPEEGSNTQIWHAWEGGNLGFDVSEHCLMGILLRVLSASHQSAAEEAQEQTIRVGLDLRRNPSQPRCTIQGLGKEASLPIPADLSGRDRVQYTLEPGRVLRASLKGIKQETGSTRYILRIGMLSRPATSSPASHFWF
jgi:hypothetical protein